MQEKSEIESSILNFCTYFSNSCGVFAKFCTAVYSFYKNRPPLALNFPQRPVFFLKTRPAAPAGGALIYFSQILPAAPPLFLSQNPLFFPRNLQNMIYMRYFSRYNIQDVY